MDSRGAAPLGVRRSGLVRALIRSLARSLVRSLAGNCYRSIVLQLVEAARGHFVSGIDPVNLGQAAVCYSRRYAAQMRDIALNHVNERCLTILLDGGCWNQR